ncbi:uncharacterized protein [Spinacia oleracea]|uniref:Reverse transcriptase domain-containing protein n=1 Tax=Spinacia oleracea TaxID=3562 RepID=A0ABM3RHF0_SPIOL|nr:uncharacterized protein LOC130469650 [Spinacia oleracea]
MARPRKQGQKSGKKNGKTKSDDQAATMKPNTRAQAKEPSPPTMVEAAISESSNSYPDDEVLIENPILTPKSSLKELQHIASVQHDFNVWLNGLSQGMDARSHFRNSDGNCLNNEQPETDHTLIQPIDHILHPIEQNTDNLHKPPVQIDLDDIVDEVNFWQSAIVCYVIGANPPQHVMDGYVHRVWGKMGVDKVSLIGRGIYLVRFLTMENCEKVLKGGPQFFDSKPLIIKPWSQDVNCAKETIKTLPIWIKLPGLDVKYWGEKSLYKIAGQIGSPIKVDQATQYRDKLLFAKVLVDVQLDQQFPTTIQFVNEKGMIVNQQVEYDWIPLVCSVCKGIGHKADACKHNKKQTQFKKVWVMKTKPVNAPTTVVAPAATQQAPHTHTPDEEGFTLANGFSKQKCQELRPVQTRNSFHIQHEVEDGVTSASHKGTGSTVNGSLDRGRNKQLEVRKFLSTHQIKLFSFLETKVKAPKLGALYLTVCPNWCFTTNICHNASGRIILGWDPAVFDVDIRDMSSEYTHCYITPRGTNLAFFGTFIYGMSDKKGREMLWDNLIGLANTIHDPWVIMGDFNSIMSMEDRVGTPVRFAEIQPMRDCMASCNLQEIKTVGRHYTWTNKQEGSNRVFSRIDRVLANPLWEDTFLTAEATFLPEDTFDHCPMVLSCYRTSHIKKPFRFYNMWTSAEGFLPLIQQNWDKKIHGCHMYKVLQKLKWIKNDLKVLNKAGFSSVEATSIKYHQEFIQAQNALHSDPTNNDLATNEKLAGEKYKKAQANYLSYLSQTAKIQWLALGDENSKLFHMSIKQRRKQNKINFIHNAAGEWIQSYEGVQEAFSQFYSSLFCVTKEDRSHVNPIVVDQGTRLTKHHRNLLHCDFQECDIKNFFLTGKILKEINITSISLVPKVTVPASVGDFRPIACCSVLYKCISKLLCKKLSQVLPDIISPTQGAFVAGRSILHNVLICQDLIKHYNRRNTRPSCLMKLDLKKAFDTVEWKFIEEVMLELGFSTFFVDLIMTCLSTT